MVLFLLTGECLPDGDPDKEEFFAFVVEHGGTTWCAREALGRLQEADGDGSEGSGMQDAAEEGST